MTSNGPRRFNRLLSRKEAANFLRTLGMPMCAQTLARLFSEKKGPLCMHIGRRAAYRESDLMDYLRQQCSAPRRSSSDPQLPASDDHLPYPANYRGNGDA